MSCVYEDIRTHHWTNSLTTVIRARGRSIAHRLLRCEFRRTPRSHSWGVSRVFNKKLSSSAHPLSGHYNPIAVWILFRKHVSDGILLRFDWCPLGSKTYGPPRCSTSTFSVWSSIVASMSAWFIYSDTCVGSNASVYVFFRS